MHMGLLTWNKEHRNEHTKTALMAPKLGATPQTCCWTSVLMSCVCIMRCRLAPSMGDKRHKHTRAAQSPAGCAIS